MHYNTPSSTVSIKKKSKSVKELKKKYRKFSAKLRASRLEHLIYDIKKRTCKLKIQEVRLVSVI